EMDWMSPETDTVQLERLKALTEGMDTIIMGRVMAAEFTRYWEDVADNRPESPEHSYAKIFVETPKIVFSKTVKSLDGRNLRVENGDLLSAVTNLKQQQGKDIIVYGGATFVSGLIKYDLIDELHLFVNPTALGTGKSIFQARKTFNLLNSVSCSNGVVINCFEPVRK
ncbi:MAG: deaminase, partial [Sphingobacteriales bacterium]